MLHNNEKHFIRNTKNFRSEIRGAESIALIFIASEIDLL